MTHAETTTEASTTFILEPPKTISPLTDNEADDAIPLPTEVAAAVDDQVERFVSALLAEDVQSDSFKAKLDSVFRLGREEISIASSLLSSRFLERNMVGMEDSPAFKAIEQMRRHLDDLDPGKEGDLLSQKKLLGIVPLGNKLKAYFRRFQSAAAQLRNLLQQIYAARDDMQRDKAEIDTIRAELWEAMRRLKSAVRFAQQLDAMLSQWVVKLKAADAIRARALEQEVLYYARQNLQDMLTQQAVCVNSYLALDVLKKTNREMIIGCDRVATTGMSALAVAQTVARATGNQVQVMNILAGVNSTIENLIAESSKQLNSHAERTARFGTSPLLGIEKMKEMFNLTFKAMDTLDNFRAKAVEVMGQNNAVMREYLQRAEGYVDKVRQDQLRTANRSLEGPVRL